jgi:hypothetical protein
VYVRHRTEPLAAEQDTQNREIPRESEIVHGACTRTDDESVDYVDGFLDLMKR